jgi:hypothetical protein
MSEELELADFWKGRASNRAMSLKEMTDDRDMWRNLAIRAYKEMFSIDQEYSDHKVWIEIEDAYEEATVE